MLVQLGEARRTLERLREAEALAERLNDDRRRGRVCVVLTNTHSLLGELDEALVTGARALEIAGRLGDLRLRILTTTYLAQAHQFRGEYERVVELATDNLAVLPADWVYEPFGNAAYPYRSGDRLWLVHEPRRARQIRRGGRARGRGDPARRADAACVHRRLRPTTLRATLHLRRGDWATGALTDSSSGSRAYRTGNVAVVLPGMVAASAWVLAQLGEASEALARLREGEQLLERQAVRGAIPSRLTTRWVVPHCCSAGSMRRRVWATVR